MKKLLSQSVGSADTNKRSDTMTLLGFPREIGLRRQLCNTREDFDSYIQTLNGKASCYTLSLIHI